MEYDKNNGIKDVVWKNVQSTFHFDAKFLARNRFPEDSHFFVTSANARHSLYVELHHEIHNESILAASDSSRKMLLANFGAKDYNKLFPSQ